jgi:ATP-binding cassette subfamily C (CFTR/MRP) protein 1
MGCFDRIQKFLLDPSRDDQRYLDEAIGSDSTGNVQHKDHNGNGNPATLIDLNAAISVDKLTVRPNPIAEPVFKGISLRFEPASVSMVAGPVGCGKTTLLRAILGELPYESGEISVSTRLMSYCAQTPWLLNESIKQNICGVTDEPEFDEEWYSSVLHACALDEDMAGLPDGDQSVIGSRGLNLSGGQRQRVVSSTCLQCVIYG